MSNLPRMPVAVEGVIDPGVYRVFTGWLRYDWSSRDRELFLEDQVRGIESRTDTERMYKFQLSLPPFSYEEAVGTISEVPSKTWDEDDILCPDEPVVPQIAKRLFCMSSNAFPGISPSVPFKMSWTGGSNPDSQSFTTEFRGKRFKVTVEEIA